MTASLENSPSIGPLIESPTVSLTPDLRHIEPIIYGDIFDYPLTREEIWRFCPLTLTLEDLSERLGEEGQDNPLAGLVDCHGGYYHLQGRECIVELRRKRAATSRPIWQRARRVAGLIQNIPFIRAMAITGSLTTDNSDEDGDPDFLVITAPNRVWTVFFFLGTIQKLTSTRTLCPNFYISENNLQVTPKDYYNAREVTQAIPLVGVETFARFLDVNHWVTDYIPNHRHAALREEQPLPRHPLLRLLGRIFEGLFGRRLGDGLERLFRKLLFHRLSCHYQSFGGEAPAEVLDAARQGRELRFHGLHHRTLIQTAIAQRVSRLEQYLSIQRRTG